MIANALVALRGSQPAQARVPCLPGGFYDLRLTNMYQTSEEIDLLRTLLPVCGWQLERDEDNEVQDMATPGKFGMGSCYNLQ